MDTNTFIIKLITSISILLLVLGILIYGLGPQILLFLKGIKKLMR